MENIKNYLFDFDGTLFDTQKLHAIVESELLSAHGVPMTPAEISAKYSGVRTEQFFSELLGDEKFAMELVKKKWEKLLPLAPTAEPLADLHNLFSSLKDRGVLFGIGTASPAFWVEEILERNNLGHFFEQGTIVGGDMVAAGKPHPETWERLQRGVPSESCLVVEDGVSGVLAAKAANMSYIVIGTAHDRFPQGSVFIESVANLIN